MDKFLSCDWGTSSFRLRIINAATLQVIAEVKNDQGIATTYQQWKELGSIVIKRETFYITIIKQHIAELSANTGIALTGVPVLLSGMASSTIGLIDMPYKQMPFSLDGSDLEVKVLNADDNPIIIISGACTVDDVMRGEETKIIGCCSSLPQSDNEQLLLMPGTHPKHIFIKGDKAIGFKTYMTGEFFDLLSTRSILATSVAADVNVMPADNNESFIAGVKAAQTTNLLHGAFMVRTNQVLKKMPAQQNYHYLSGLLMGTELKEIKPKTNVYLVGGVKHMLLYALACDVIDIRVLGKLNADEALVKGQRILFKSLFL
jgi:2-dehydro-3-deoxygalactonokinase